MFLTESKVVYLPDIKEEDMDYEKIVQDLDLQSENLYEDVPLNEGRKRMRLHQLTWEEKIQRKKLRNRIAAQTSRDRKKAKMDHLEESVKSLKQQNELLFMEIEELRKKNEMLVDANAELQKALAQTPYTCPCLRKVREEEKKEIVKRSNEQICVEDGHFFERPAESSELPQQKGSWPASAQGDTFLDDLERLASSLLEEVEHNDIGRDTELVLQEISGTGQKECTHNTKMVGETPEKLESSRSNLNSTQTNQQHCLRSAELTTEEKISMISTEHSYAQGSKHPHSIASQSSNSDSNFLNFNIPTITISESDIISEIENELKKDIESTMLPSKEENFSDALTFPNFCSPRSEVSSDQGYESVGSPEESGRSRRDSFDDFDDLWRDTVSELFPELL